MAFATPVPTDLLSTEHFDIIEPICYPTAVFYSVNLREGIDDVDES
jgi:hypothetical protein